MDNTFHHAISTFKCVQKCTFETEEPEKEREQKELLTARAFNYLVLLGRKLELHMKF